jgi:hypothetical protein
MATRHVKVQVLDAHVSLVALSAAERALVAKVVSLANVKVEVGPRVVLLAALFARECDEIHAADSTLNLSRVFVLLLLCVAQQCFALMCIARNARFGKRHSHISHLCGSVSFSGSAGLAASLCSASMM